MFDSPAWWYLHIYGWKDIAEVMLFSSAVYYFSSWLRQDQQKPLLLTFYSYCTLLTVCHAARLNTAGSALLIFAPVILVIFVVLHQDILQRNFVTLHNITPARNVWQEWTEILIRSCLVAVSDNKALSCIIEKKNALDDLLTTPYTFKCKLSEGLLDLVINSNGFDASKIIWLQDNGTLLAVNSSWKKSSVDTWLAKEVKEQEPWLQDALFFTSKTDALYFKINPQTRTFTLVAQGKVLEQVSAHAALKTIRKYLGHFDDHKKGEVHASGHKVPSSEQSLT
jgi:hypothetical protein